MSGEENLREAFQDIAICHLSAEKAKIGTGMSTNSQLGSVSGAKKTMFHNNVKTIEDTSETIHLRKD